MSRLADQYLAARDQKLSSKEGIKRDSARYDAKDSQRAFSSACTLKFFLCDRVGHRTIDYRVKPERGRNDYNIPARHAVTCYQCGEIGHEKRFCRNQATPLDLRHNRTELDALRKLEKYRMMPKRRTKNIWSLNLRRKLKSYVMALA